MRFSTAFLTLALATSHGVPALAPNSVAAPSPPGLPDRRPFGFGGAVTGGGDPADNATTTYVVGNMADLRAALTLATPRVVYVRGRIRGDGRPANTTTPAAAAAARCQRYIDESTVPRFNFTLYLRALNTSYTAAVREAAAAGRPFAGRNATEYLALLGRQNGWRGVAQNRQKAQESIDARGDLTLVGWDPTAHLDGVSLVFNGQRNVVVRNLRLTPPQDCFPAPEGGPPGPWNARYDAVSLVATRGVWLDGNVFTDGFAAVAPEPLPGGWEVDRFDGLVDAEDGTDDVTFSHNEVANHHKSLMWGGGEKEGPQDLGRMRFTVFGNRFRNSLSRNPLMRFGTFYIVNNVFANYNNAGPRFVDDEGEESAGAVPRRINDDNDDEDDAEPPAYVPDFQYHMGVYNMSSVLVAGNYFAQTGAFPEDATRLFTFSHLATPARPATLCSPPDLPAGAAAAAVLGGLARPRSVLNGTPLNLTAVARRTFAWYIASHDDAQPGGLATDCAGFRAQEMPATFASAADVLDYVEGNVGQF